MGAAGSDGQKRIAGVVFDLDGTLTVPYLDFDAIRAEIGGIDGPILEALETWTATEAARAYNILHRHELEAAEAAQLHDDAKEMLDELHRQGRKVGLLTRNRRDSVERICRNHDLNFEAVVTREDGPAKPDPFGVLRACELLGVDPQQSCMVGDYVFDLMAGRRAGAISILLKVNENHASFMTEADYAIDRLGELPGLLEKIDGDNAAD